MTTLATLPLLPVKPTDDECSRYVARIVATYRSATMEQLTEGCLWYPSAQAIAAECGDVRTGAGVIAALSANKGWAPNVALARRAFRGDVGGHTRDTLAKVNRILAGVDPSDVLPMDMKTGHFYLCIADPEHPSAVVVDRHAHDIAAGMKYGNAERGLDSVGRYGSIAQAYRDAADVLGLIPCRVQAVTWTVVTQRARNDRKMTGRPGWGEADA